MRKHKSPSRSGATLLSGTCKARIKLIDLIKYISIYVDLHWFPSQNHAYRCLTLIKIIMIRTRMHSELHMSISEGTKPAVDGSRHENRGCKTRFGRSHDSYQRSLGSGARKRSNRVTFPKRKRCAWRLSAKSSHHDTTYRPIGPHPTCIYAKSFKST